MNPENNPPGVPSESDVSSEGAGNVDGDNTGDQLLESINRATGRDYKTLDDAQKGIQETYSYVGQMGELKEKAAKYDEVQAQKSDKQKTQDTMTEYTEKYDRLEFQYNHPEAKGVVEEVAALAKARGVSFEEAYNSSTLKAFVEKQQAEQEPVTSTVTNPNSRIALGDNRGPVSTDDFRKLSIDEQRKIVEKLPMGNSPLGKGVWKSSGRSV